MGPLGTYGERASSPYFFKVVMVMNVLEVLLEAKDCFRHRHIDAGAHERSSNPTPTAGLRLEYYNAHKHKSHCLDVAAITDSLRDTRELILLTFLKRLRGVHRPPGSNTPRFPTTKNVETIASQTRGLAASTYYMHGTGFSTLCAKTHSSTIPSMQQVFGFDVFLTIEDLAQARTFLASGLKRSWRALCMMHLAECASLAG